MFALQRTSLAVLLAQMLPKSVSVEENKFWCWRRVRDYSRNYHKVSTTFFWKIAPFFLWVGHFMSYQPVVPRCIV